MAVVTGPLLRVCPNCFAQIGFPCTQPTDNGRRNVNWFHDARTRED